MFCVLSCLSLPALVINSFGSGRIKISDFTDLSLTTLGNLGDTLNQTKIVIPQCAGSYNTETCEIDKVELAEAYVTLDLVASVLFILGYMWLRNFEKKEVVYLDKSLVSASDYTIYIPKLPPGTTEKELRKHLMKVVGHRIVDINLV